MDWLIELVILLVIAGICGGIAQALVGGTRGGCVAAIALGFVGALIGTLLARIAKLPDLFVIRIDEDTQFPVVWSIIGATLFAAVLAFFTRGRRV